MAKHTAILRSGALGVYDLVTMGIWLDPLEGKTWSLGDEVRKILFTQLDDSELIPGAQRQDEGHLTSAFSEPATQQGLRRLFIDNPDAFRAIEHESTHRRQNAASPYCLYAANAFRYSMINLRRVLQSLSAQHDFDQAPLAIPILGATGRIEQPEEVTQFCTEINRLHDTWLLSEGNTTVDLGMDIAINAIGRSPSGELSLIPILYRENDDSEPVNCVLGARAIVEGMAKISEIFWYGELIDDHSYIEEGITRELLGGSDIYGVTCRLLSQVLGLPPVGSAIAVMAISDVAMFTSPSAAWPHSICDSDNPIDVFPAQRFIAVVDGIKTGTIPLDPTTVVTKKGYGQFLAAGYSALGCRSYEETLASLSLHMERTRLLRQEGYSPEKIDLLECGMRMRQDGKGYLLAFPWITESVHERHANPNLDAARIWVEGGAVIGDRAMSVEAVQELWDIAWVKWFVAIVFTGGLFSSTPVPGINGVWCCKQDVKCSMNLHAVPDDCSWRAIFQKFIGVSPNCFKEENS